MTKEELQKGMTKEQINKELGKFNTTSERIKYLQSIESKANLMPITTKKAYYEELGNLMRKKGDLLKMAEYYEKAGVKDISKSIWEKQGDFEMAYRNQDTARAHYNKAGATQKEEQILRQKEKRLWEKICIVLAIGSFFCSFIFLSGRITGNTILDASFKTSNIIGALLFIVGVVASFFYFERRK